MMITETTLQNFPASCKELGFLLQNTTEFETVVDVYDDLKKVINNKAADIIIESLQNLENIEKIRYNRKKYLKFSFENHVEVEDNDYMSEITALYIPEDNSKDILVFYKDIDGFDSMIPLCYLEPTNTKTLISAIYNFFK